MGHIRVGAAECRNAIEAHQGFVYFDNPPRRILNCNASGRGPAFTVSREGSISPYSIFALWDIDLMTVHQARICVGCWQQLHLPVPLRGVLCGSSARPMIDRSAPPW
jgi:hypothetical protein